LFILVFVLKDCALLGIDIDVYHLPDLKDVGSFLYRGHEERIVRIPTYIIHLRLMSSMNELG